MESRRKSKVDSTLEVAPLRSLDDFILSSARFQIPNNWAHRVKSNLIYYQSNYIVVFIIFFLMYWNFHPLEVSAAILSVFICFLINLIPNPSTLTWTVSKIISAIVMYKSVKNVTILSLGVFFPVTFIIMHASFRMRGVQNKIVNAVENSGVKNTPMGLFLNKIMTIDIKKYQK